MTKIIDDSDNCENDVRHDMGDDKDIYDSNNVVNNDSFSYKFHFYVALLVLVFPLIARFTLEYLLKLRCGKVRVIVRRPLVLASVSNSSPAVEQHPQVFGFVMNNLKCTNQNRLGILKYQKENIK